MIEESFADREVSEDLKPSKGNAGTPVTELGDIQRIPPQVQAAINRAEGRIFALLDTPYPDTINSSRAYNEVQELVRTLGKRAHYAAQTFLRWLDDKNRRISACGGLGCGLVGESMADLLLPRFQDESKGFETACFIGSMGPEIAPAIHNSIKSSTGLALKNSMCALVFIAEHLAERSFPADDQRLKEALPIFRSHLQDEDEDLKRLSIRFIGEMADRESLDLLLSLEGKVSGYTENCLFICLGKLGEMRVIPVLSTMRKEGRINHRDCGILKQVLGMV